MVFHTQPFPLLPKPFANWCFLGYQLPASPSRFRVSQNLAKSCTNHNIWGSWPLPTIPEASKTLQNQQKFCLIIGSQSLTAATMAPKILHNLWKFNVPELPSLSQPLPKACKTNAKSIFQKFPAFADIHEFLFFLAGSSAGSLSASSSACFSCSSNLRMPWVKATNSGVIDCIIIPWYFVM